MMANYDYQCNDCGTVFEVCHGMNESPVIPCPECGKTNPEKLISGGGGFIMKGRMVYSPSDPAVKGKSAEHPSACSCCHSQNTCPGAQVKNKYGLS